MFIRHTELAGNDHLLAARWFPFLHLLQIGFPLFSPDNFGPEIAHPLEHLQREHSHLIIT